MKRVLYIVVMCVLMCSLDASAQYISSKRVSLSSRSSSGGVINITEDARVKEAVGTVEYNTKTPAKVPGWRFMIFNDSEQFADERASRALRKFRTEVRNVSSYISVESPTYRILVGDCFDMEDVALLREKLEDDYPEVPLVEEDIPLRLFLRVEGANYMKIERNGVVTGGVEFEETYFDAEYDTTTEGEDGEETLVIETPKDFNQDEDVVTIAPPAEEEETVTIAPPAEEETATIAPPIE